MKTRYGQKQPKYHGRKSELLRAIERRLLIEHMEQAITAFMQYCRELENRRTAIELERRGVL